MRKHDTALDRRQFLRQSAALGLATLFAPTLASRAWAASRDRAGDLSRRQSGLAPSLRLQRRRHQRHLAALIEPLIDMDYGRKEYVGVLAESWEFQGRKWMFQLKKNIRFHNGAPFTSKDVAYSIERMKTDKRSLQGGDIADVEVETPDDFTVVITTKNPNALLLDRLDTRYIISKAAAEKYGDQADNYAVGTGPYKFVSWQRGGNLVLTRNDDYWGPKPEIKEVTVQRRQGRSGAGRRSAVRSGRRDQQSAHRRNRPRSKASAHARRESARDFACIFSAMNVTLKPFDNKLVRQAINYAVDPAVMMKHIFDGNGDVLNGPLASNMIGFDPTIKRYPYDPKKARELLAKAGFPNGVELKLHFSPDRHLKGREVCEVIANQLAKVGIKAELVGAGVRRLLGQGRCQRRQAALLLRRPHRLSMPTRSTINISTPASPSESATATRNSTSSSKRNSAPPIRKNASPSCSKRDEFSWRTFPSCRSTRLRKSTAWRETLSGKARRTQPHSRGGNENQRLSGYQDR